MITVDDLYRKKENQEKITMLTAYDYPTAVLEDKAGVDIILIGDSVGTNVLGYKDVTEVTMDDMVHHIKAVARGSENSFVLGDMPYGSFKTQEIALNNARRFMDAGASGIKMEGEEDVIDQMEYVASSGIPVCAHIGYTPQTDGNNASAQGKDIGRAIELLTIAERTKKAGAHMIVLELIPERLAKEITSILSIPTIGIGAGRFCDGQVQVIYDILGIPERIYKHAKAYDNIGEKYKNVISSFVNEVKALQFPTKDNSAEISDDLYNDICQWIQKNSPNLSMAHQK